MAEAPVQEPKVIAVIGSLLLLFTCVAIVYRSYRKFTRLRVVCLIGNTLILVFSIFNIILDEQIKLHLFFICLIIDAISTSFVAVLLMDDRDNSNNINEKSYLQTKRHTKSMKCWFGLIGGYNVFTIFSTILGLIKYNDNGSKALSIYLTQNLFGILVVVFTQITIFRFTVYPSSSSTITNSDDNLLLKNHQHSANPEKVSIIIWYMLITGFLLLLFLAFYVNCLFDMDLEKKWNVISECGFVIYGLVFTVMALSPPKWVIEILRELVLSQRSGDNESDCVELAGL